MGQPSERHTCNDQQKHLHLVNGGSPPRTQLDWCNRTSVWLMPQSICRQCQCDDTPPAGGQGRYSLCTSYRNCDSHSGLRRECGPHCTAGPCSWQISGKLVDMRTLIFVECAVASSINLLCQQPLSAMHGNFPVVIG
jgi:hypothetical protein